MRFRHKKLVLGKNHPLGYNNYFYTTDTQSHTRLEPPTPGEFLCMTNPTTQSTPTQLPDMTLEVWLRWLKRRANNQPSVLDALGVRTGWMGAQAGRCVGRQTGGLCSHFNWAAWNDCLGLLEARDNHAHWIYYFFFSFRKIIGIIGISTNETNNAS